MPVHYAGSSAGIEELRSLCKKRNLFLIEDAAQSFGAKRLGKPVGGTSHVTCFSLHDTKNIAAGEGGLIATDSDELAGQIEIQIEKGTNRQRFFRGQVDKYTWVDLGSSYIASDLLAAVALGQIEKVKEVTARRQVICQKFQKGLADFSPHISFQKVPAEIETNGHIAGFVIDPKMRGKVLTDLKAAGVQALFHYVPLHDAPYAKERGYTPSADLENTRWVSEGLVRLPVYYSMTDEEFEFALQATRQVLRNTLNL
jgi:dTDP-4-amino-4,6-dideoxygalactose transaminase